MEDDYLNDLRTASEVSISSIENVRRKMILLEIEENEKSKFDDNLSEEEFEPNWKETEKSVTETEEIDATTTTTITNISNENENNFQFLNEKNTNNQLLESYYQMPELNRDHNDNKIRFARVPSQYQLDALSEMFLFDVPQNAYQYQRKSEVLENSSQNQIVTNHEINNYNGITPYFVNSEYVSELLI